MTEPVRLLILSDIHAFSSRPPDLEEPSYAKANAPGLNPFAALAKETAQWAMPIDFVVCPGDICDQADEEGLVYAWDQLAQVATSLGAHLVATAGNHDLDSRFLTTSFNPKGALQRLTPTFPHEGEHASDCYWARNFSALKERNTIFVSVNSAAFHGYHNEDRMFREFEHGRISPDTVHAISKSLAELDDDSVQHHILLCHHHPQVVGPFRDVEGNSAMRDAHILLDQLTDQGRPWLIVHGHRHYPSISYAAGGANAPVIFSAGSFSRRLGDIYEGQVDNQFYVVELLQSTACESLDLDIAGIFTSWTWGHSEGWIPAPPRTGLPRQGGFGYRGSVLALAKRIVALLQQSQAPSIRWVTVRQQLPQVQYLVPTDLHDLMKRLTTLGVVVEPSLDNLYPGLPPTEIGVA